MHAGAQRHVSLPRDPSGCSPFGTVSSMSFFWQKVAGKMAWDEAW